MATFDPTAAPKAELFQSGGAAGGGENIFQITPEQWSTISSIYGNPSSFAQHQANTGSPEFDFGNGYSFAPSFDKTDSFAGGTVYNRASPDQGLGKGAYSTRGANYDASGKFVSPFQINQDPKGFMDRWGLAIPFAAPFVASALGLGGMAAGAEAATALPGIMPETALTAGAVGEAAPTLTGLPFSGGMAPAGMGFSTGAGSLGTGATAFGTGAMGFEPGMAALMTGGAAPSLTGLPFSGNVPAGLGFNSPMTTELAAEGGFGAGAGFGQTMESTLASFGQAAGITPVMQAAGDVNLGSATGADMDAAFQGPGLGGGASAALNPGLLEQLSGLIKSGGMSTEAIKSALSSPGALMKTLIGSPTSASGALQMGGSVMQLLAGLEGRKNAKRLQAQMQGLSEPLPDVPLDLPSNINVGLTPQQLALPDPSDVTKIPGYQAGMEAVRRSLSSQGYQGSGNMMTALAKYGGDFYDKYVSQLRNQNQQTLESNQQGLNFGLTKRQQEINRLLAERNQRLNATNMQAGPVTGNMSSMALLAQGGGALLRGLFS